MTRVLRIILATLPDEVKVVSPNDDGTLHLQLLDDAIEDSAANLDESGEGTLFVDVIALFGLLGGLEAQTHVLHVTDLDSLDEIRCFMGKHGERLQKRCRPIISQKKCLTFLAFGPAMRAALLFKKTFFCF